ncbi:MAG TPA: hypothetical protein VKB88_38150 [Bryobacteraceae bacterium]|nr:hypothetical protein [Bryobacteraceae bacterium]
MTKLESVLYTAHVHTTGVRITGTPLASVQCHVRHGHVYRGLIDRLMSGVRQVDEDRVRSGREPLDDAHTHADAR